MKNNGEKLEDKPFFPFEHGPFSGDIRSFSAGVKKAISII